jgi:hypothetical protein
MNAMAKLSSGLAVLTVSLGIGACSKPVSIEEVIDCSQFERSAPGRWRTNTTVFLNYTQGWGKRGVYYDPGVEAGSEIAAALEKKCVP